MLLLVILMFLWIDLMFYSVMITLIKMQNFLAGLSHDFRTKNYCY